MAFKTYSRPVVRHVYRRGFATTPRWRVATGAAPSLKSQSNLPPELRDSIQRDAALSNPDPPRDSQTGRLVGSHQDFMVPTYVRPPFMIAKGEGCRVWDVENRQYLDFTAGIAVNGLGHCDPGVVNAISQQAATLVHASNLYHNPWTGALSELLVSATRASGGMRDVTRAFICNSGSEANESALKFARKHGYNIDPSGRKSRILCFKNAFHGRTMGALSATFNIKYQKPFAPMVPGFDLAPFNDLDEAARLITDETCGVIVEPIQGEGGVNEATPEFLALLRQKCDEHGALLIFDEIQCGLSRTGTLWAHSSTGVPADQAPHPDILTTAKALGNGFPIGASLVTERVSNALQTGDHGTTYGGNPLGSRVAHHVLGRLAEPALQQQVRASEALIRTHVAALQAKFPDTITEVRGRGLILGVQLAIDPAPIVTAARERGLLIITCGERTLRLVPPLVVSEAEIEEAFAILDEALVSVVQSSEGAAHARGTPGQQEMGPKGRTV